MNFIPVNLQFIFSRHNFIFWTVYQFLLQLVNVIYNSDEL